MTALSVLLCTIGFAFACAFVVCAVVGAAGLVQTWRHRHDD